MVTKDNYLLCTGAVCKCTFGKTIAKLKVLIQSKHYINDEKGIKKLMATHKEVGQPFEAPFFGSCAKLNNNPCKVNVTEWSNIHTKIQIENGGHPLHDNSKASCAFGAKDCINVTWHGQTAVTSQKNFNDANKGILQSINPLINTHKLKLKADALTVAPKGVGRVKLGTAKKIPVQPVGSVINVTMAMFFDGTGNNFHNTDERKMQSEIYKEIHKDDHTSSYENEYSNVARLYNNYSQDEDKYVFAQYIQGMGTTWQKEDDTKAGAGLAKGSTGIPLRVKHACQLVADTLSSSSIVKKNNIKEVNILTVDLFGFSRGSAAARHFIHEITKPAQKSIDKKDEMGNKAVLSFEDENGNKIKGNEDIKLTDFPEYGYLGAYCRQANVKIKTIVIRFAGLYDTVSSYHNAALINSMPDTGTDAPKMFKNDTAELHLNAIAKARTIFHFTAADEHRGNFSLTDIRSAGETSGHLSQLFNKSGKLSKSFSLPGVHSDVGGCYADNFSDLVVFNTQTGTQMLINDTKEGVNDNNEKVIKAERLDLINQGWFTADELTTHSSNSYFRGFTLEGHRKQSISNKYSFIPCHLMAEIMKNLNITRFKNNPIPIDQLLIEDKYKVKGNALLEFIKNRLHAQVFDGAPRLAFKYFAEILKKHDTDMEDKTNWSDPCKKEMQEQRDLRELRHKYLHWNAYYNRNYVKVNYPRIENGRRTRLILAG